MKTVTSLSGGRTSSYMALHYPTDYNIFSLVRIEDKRCSPKDPSIINYVEGKIKTDFIATAESDLTLYVLRQLEQDLGKEIVWVTGDTFEQIIRNSNKKGNYLPNRRKRFCTQFMKLEPIFWWCYLNLFDCENDSIQMNIGYRYDEPKRVTDDVFKFNKSTKNFGKRFRNWEEIEWRDSVMPLRKAGIDNLIVKSFFAKNKNYMFPIHSNCVGCFNKKEIELQEQFLYEPEKMRWFNDMEILTGSRFNMHISLDGIKNKKYTDDQIQSMIEFPVCNCSD